MPPRRHAPLGDRVPATDRWIRRGDLDFCADGCRPERFFSCLLVAVHFVEDGLREGLQKFFAGEALPADGELGFAFGGVTVVVGDRRQKLSPYGRFFMPGLLWRQLINNGSVSK